MHYEEAKEYFECRRCGECCQNFNAKGYSEDYNTIREWLGVFNFPIPIRMPKRVEVQITIKDAPCFHWDPVNRICKDYLNRPELCRSYFCEKSRIKELPKE
jgi:Fe-S-cluster containining protein